MNLNRQQDTFFDLRVLLQLVVTCDIPRSWRHKASLKPSITAGPNNNTLHPFIISVPYSFAMTYLTHCLCLLVILPAVCAVSLTASGNPHSSSIHLKRSNEHGTYRVKRSHDLTRHGFHVWRYSSPNVHASKFVEPMGMGGSDSGVESPRKKEDEQIESGPVYSGAMPPPSEQSDGSGSPSAASSLGTVFASTNTPPLSAINIESTSVISSSTQAQSPSQGQPTQSQRASSTLAAASGSSSSSSAFSPALLAFILVPVCVFLLGMSFALYRIYGKPGNRPPPASPMVLGDATTLGSGYHRGEAILLDDPTTRSRDSILGYDVNKRGSIKWEPRVERNPSKSSTSIMRGSIRDPRASHYLMPPFHTHGAGTYNSTPSRVLRPHVSRPYSRPHLAFTADPESAIPLIVNANKYQSYDNGRGGYTTPNSKGKGKENSHHEKNRNARKHRDDMSTTPLNTSPRSLPFRDPLIPDVFSDADIRFQARMQRSHLSLVNMTKDEKQVDIPSQSAANTSFDIGLAMLTEISSPNVGLGLDLSPSSPSLKYNPRKIGKNLNGSGAIQDSAMPYLEHSVTAGSKGLAYLSNSSGETMLSDNCLPADPNDDELDIASALAVYKTQQSSDRLKAQKVPVNRMSETEGRGNENEGRDSPASSPSTDARYTPSDIKAPTLPTLSEMALSRADPLYESVTNELFSTYGMRMSTANGGQKSRVSARISRMLSWFAGADSNNTGSRMSGVENRMSCEDPKPSAGHKERMSNITSPGGVQPLRIGKARKNAA